MNAIISIFFTIFFFELLQRKKDIPTIAVPLTILGAILPLGDYAYRLFRSQPLFFSCEVIFQSFVYQGVFWSIIVVYHWIVTRDFRKSFQFYLPLWGLCWYAFFSVLGTDGIPFFYPLSTFHMELGFVKDSYLILLVPISLVWITKKWSRLSLYIISWISFSYLAVFLIFASGFRIIIINSLAELDGSSGDISIIPANYYRTEWRIVSKDQDKYYSYRYKLFGGLQNNPQSQTRFDDFELMQNVLFHPVIHCLYFHGYENPIAKIEIQKEKRFIQFNEFVPASELFKIDKLVIIQNRSGRIVDIQINYRFLNWKSITFHL